MEAEAESSSPRRKKPMDAYTRWLRKQLEEKKKNPDPEDFEAYRAAKFEGEWNRDWGGRYGCFEDETSRFADRSSSKGYALWAAESLQIYSVKITWIKGDLQWPLRVYGLVAARDIVDHNRNIIFRRPREDCQIVTKGFPTLNLTGPKRAIMLLDPIALEVDLRVKASDASTLEEDYHLSSLALPIKAQMLSYSYLINGEEYSSKLSTLELTYSHIASSVEATIDVRVVHGEWPPGSSGSFSARTKSIDNMFIELLKFGYVEEVCVDDADGSIKLSRSVVSVERTGLLLIDVRAFDDGALLLPTAPKSSLLRNMAEAATM